MSSDHSCIKKSAATLVRLGRSQLTMVELVVWGVRSSFIANLIHRMQVQWITTIQQFDGADPLPSRARLRKGSRFPQLVEISQSA